MAKKDKRKDESNKKEESHPIVADPRLGKTVLHNLVWVDQSKIIMRVIDPNKEDEMMSKDKETSTPNEKPQTQQPSKIQADPSLDRIIKKGLDTDKEEGQK